MISSSKSTSEAPPAIHPTAAPSGLQGFVERFGLSRLGARGLFLLTAALLFVLLVLRRPDSLWNAQFWCEDAALFLRDQLVYGFWRSVMVPYSDYLHFVPRLTAVLGSIVPLTWAPFAFNLTALLIGAIACSLFVLPAYRYVLPSDLQRFVVCALVACALYSDEVAANITDIQVYLAVAAVLIVFHRSPSSRPPRLRNAILIGMAGAAIACTCPASVLILPFLLWQLLRRRSTDRIWLGLMTAGVALQLATVLTNHSDSLTTPDQLLTSTLISFVYRAVFSQIGGVSLSIWVSQHGVGSVVLLTLIGITIWLTWFFFSSDKQSRWTLLVCLYLLLGSIGMAMAGRAGLSKKFLTLLSSEPRAERLFFLPACVLILLVALSIRKLWPSAPSAVAGLLLCLIYSGGLLMNFRIRPFDDMHWAEKAQKVEAWRRAWDAGQPVKGLFAPTTPGRPWGVRLPTRLAAATRDSRWEGLLVGIPGRGGSYLIDGGHKHLIQDPNCIYERGLEWDLDLVRISAGDLGRIPDGAPVGPCPSAQKPVVDASAKTPSVVSVTASSAAGGITKLTAVYRNTAGFDQFNLVQLYIPGKDGTAKSGCWVYYKPESNAFWLFDGQNDLGPLTPGTNASKESSQCVLQAAGSSGSGSADDLKVTYALTFKRSFTGKHTVLLYGQVVSWLGSGWQAAGSFDLVSGDPALDVSVPDKLMRRTVGQLRTGDLFSQSFVTHADYFSRIELAVATYGKTIPSGWVAIRLLERSDNREIASWRVSLSSVKDNVSLDLDFTPIPDSKDKRYVVSLQPVELPAGYPVTIWLSDHDVYPEGTSQLNGKDLGADTAFRTYYSTSPVVKEAPVK